MNIFFTHLLTSHNALNIIVTDSFHIYINLPYTYLSTSILQSIYLYIYLNIYLSIYLFIYLSIYLSINLFIYLSIYLSIYKSIYISIYLSEWVGRGTDTISSVKHNYRNIFICTIYNIFSLVYGYLSIYLSFYLFRKR